VAEGFKTLDGFETDVTELGTGLGTDRIEEGDGVAALPPLNGEKCLMALQAPLKALLSMGQEKLCFSISLMSSRAHWRMDSPPGVEF